MFYEEKIIDGVLHWRGIPGGDWIKKLPVTEELASQINIKPSAPKPGICHKHG